MPQIFRFNIWCSRGSGGSLVDKVLVSIFASPELLVRDQVEVSRASRVHGINASGVRASRLGHLFNGGISVHPLNPPTHNANTFGTGRLCLDIKASYKTVGRIPGAKAGF
ncbi:hypothetical protein B0H11DRAFT_1927205 [Mycena galericulata]|nr:hypothetical protein B0H11DRAFT_1927205 [Mycena galericulata]